MAEIILYILGVLFVLYFVAGFFIALALIKGFEYKATFKEWIRTILFWPRIFFFRLTG